MTGKDGKVYSLIFEITVNLRNAHCQSHHIRAASGKTFPVFPAFPVSPPRTTGERDHGRPSTSAAKEIRPSASKGPSPTGERDAGRLSPGGAQS